MLDSITAKCLINSKSYLDFNRFHRFYMNKSSINIIIFPLLIIAFAVFNWLIGNTFIGWILFAAGIIAPLWIFAKFRLDTGLKIKEFDLKNNPRVFYTINFNSDGIRLKNSKESVSYKWDNIYMFYYTNKYTYLYLTKSNAFIIPHTSLINSDINDLNKYISSHLNSDKIKRIKPFYEKN